MTDSDLDPTAAELEAAQSKTEELKAKELEKDDIQGRLKAYTDTLKMRELLAQDHNVSTVLATELWRSKRSARVHSL